MIVKQKTSIVLAAALALVAGDLHARGFKGGGGGHSRPAVSRPSPSRPAVSRPAPSRPAVSRPSAPHLGGGHSVSRPNMNSPSISRPSVSRPNVSQPSFNRPAGNFAGGGQPQFQRPSGGLKPSTRPSLPSIGQNRPSGNLPSIGNRPGGSLPDFANRPTTRPSIPSLGGNHAGGNFPGIATGNRPGNNLPDFGAGNRPGGNFPNIGAGNRPSAGDLGDFLGMDRPVRPETLPGTVRPGIVDNRPNLPNRPGGGGDGFPNFPNRPGGDGGGIPNFPNRPGGDGGGIPNFPNRPGGDGGGIPNFPNRPGGGGDRPWHPDPNRPWRPNPDRPWGPDRLPDWANRPGSDGIHDRWNNVLDRPGRGGLDNWIDRHPDRRNYWNSWGSGIRNNWNYNNYHRNDFNASWWDSHYTSVNFNNWNYGYGFGRQPWGYWWGTPTYAGLTNWFTWSAPANVWSEPIYYDYGTGGNVYYDNDQVYVAGQALGTAADYAASAAALAAVEPPATQAEAAEAEWMPLGTFAVSSTAQDVDPSRTIQLAVNKEGIVSGTLYNSSTDQAQSVLGQVDKNTQRVAFHVGDNQNIVIETGLYNLTQNEAPVLVHFGADKVENWLLVRLEDSSNGQ